MSTIKCTNCSNLIPNESAFCPFCGNKIEPPKNEKPCHKCNKFIPLDSEFCPFCGVQIDDNANHPRIISTQNIVNNQSATTSVKTKYNSTNISTEYKRTAAKHIKVLKDEEIILIGDIHKKAPSIVFCFLSLIYYIACFLLFYFSHTIEKSRLSSGGVSYYFLGFIQYKYRRYGEAKAEYFVGMVIIIILICLLFALVPYWFYKVKSTNLLQHELVLTDQHIYYCFPIEGIKPFVISLKSVKSIECKPCTWFKDAHQIKIVLNTNVKHQISGLSNAPQIIDATMKIQKNKKNNEE